MTVMSPTRVAPSPAEAESVAADRHAHARTAAELATELGTPVELGLSEVEARRRLARYGPNQLEVVQPPSFGVLLLRQLGNPLIILLLFAAGVGFYLSDPHDALVIVAVVAINCLIGAYQEFKAERALAGLQAMSAPRARVRRGGEAYEIPACEVVPGDVVLVRAGDLVPADGRLLSTASLQVDESPLTGESVAVEKDPDLVLPVSAALPDRVNMLFHGTSVTFGHGRLLATATGGRSEVGQLARSVSEAGQRATPLERQVSWLAKVLSLLAIAASGAVLALGLLRGQPLTEMLLIAISLAVAAVPSGLPAVVTIVLALGVQRMARRRAIVRRLSAVEALGAATVICTDKTGTLTLGEMRATGVLSGGQLLDIRDARLWQDGQPVESGAVPGLHDLLRAVALCNNAHLEPVPIGDPTERALLRFARDLGADRAPLEAARPRTAELPFSSDRKRMTTIHRAGPTFIALTKGAPDVVLALCTRTIDSGGRRAFAAGESEAIGVTVDALAAQGLRILALADRTLPAHQTLASEPRAEDVEHGLTFLGLIALLDPPRPEVPDALAATRAAGIRTVMITGDHPTTAGSIAMRLGLADPIADGRIVTGSELATMDETTLAETVASASVYARIAPQQKLTIVRALQDQGDVVAMTGDGANDAPALRQSDIGVAMGIRGTEVAKDAADVVLTDDHYATIVAAVEEGRTIYGNLRKTVLYLVTGNFGEILVLFLAMLASLPLPLLPVQILWINLMTDALPGTGLGMDPREPGSMGRPPRKPGESFLPRWMIPLIVVPSVLVALVTLAAFGVALARDPENLIAAQSAAFATLALAHLGLAWPLRSLRGSAFRCSPLTNPVLLASAVVGVVLLLVLLYTGPGQALFHTYPLDLTAWAVTLVLSPVPFLGTEAVKAVHARLGRTVPFPPDGAS